MLEVDGKKIVNINTRSLYDYAAGIDGIHRRSSEKILLVKGETEDSEIVLGEFTNETLAQIFKDKLSEIIKKDMTFVF